MYTRDMYVYDNNNNNNNISVWFLFSISVTKRRRCRTYLFARVPEFNSSTEYRIKASAIAVYETNIINRSK
jgi:hypothetical protein